MKSLISEVSEEFPIFYGSTVWVQPNDLHFSKTQTVLKSSKLDLNCTFAISSSTSLQGSSPRFKDKCLPFSLSTPFHFATLSHRSLGAQKAAPLLGSIRLRLDFSETHIFASSSSLSLLCVHHFLPGSSCRSSPSENHLHKNPCLGLCF